jgi:plastocyanin
MVGCDTTGYTGGYAEDFAANGVLGGVRRTSLAATLSLVILTFGCTPAFAANQAVSVSSNVFEPASVTITQNETVTWTNTGGSHNVKFDDGLFEMPADPSATMWTVFRTFPQPGSYTYFCEAHQADGMTGTVVVNPAPPGGGGGGGGGGSGGGGGPGPIADTAPVSSLISPSKQDIDKLFVRASMNEAGTLAATGRVSVPGGASELYRFKRASKTVAASQSVKLRLKLSKKALKSAKRALRRGRKLRAKITLTARDATGHETLRRQTIRLTR